MNRHHFRQILGTSLFASVALFNAGCYGFKGGGGFPSDIKTLYIEPFENQTVQVELDQQLFRKLQEKLPSALGARTGGEETADAVVRGKILKYDDVGENYRATSSTTTSGQTNNNVDVVSLQVTITVAVEIVDRKRNVVLWDSQSLVGRGQYNRLTGKDTEGREIALNHILQQIIDGAQSQW